LPELRHQGAELLPGTVNYSKEKIMNKHKTSFAIAALFVLGSTLGAGTVAHAGGLGVGGSVGVGGGAGIAGAGVGARGDMGISGNVATPSVHSEAAANSNGLPSVDRDTGLDRAADRAHQRAGHTAAKLKSEKNRVQKMDSDDAHFNTGANASGDTSISK
jgi:hypothetical protein